MLKLLVVNCFSTEMLPRKDEIPNDTSKDIRNASSSAEFVHSDEVSGTSVFVKKWS